MGSTIKRLVKFALVLAILALPLVVYWQRQAILDWWRLRGYDPPQAITALAADSQMSDKAKHIFYVNRPLLIDKVEDFRQQCTISEQTIVLGCYHPNQQGIYVYSVKDERLGGIAQVTAAHEMLHAAYDRLTPKDKAYINAQIEDYYKNQLGDDRVKATIESYKQTEPDELTNEMHSIFGTEIAALPKELEQYYSRYFKNRQAVVAYSQDYEEEFISRKNRAKALEERLNGLRDSINAQEQTLKTELGTIKTDRERLDSRNGAAVDAFNARVDAYNQKVERYKRDVATYNSLLEQYNQLAGELNTLYEAIDTRVEATTTQ